MSTSFDEAVAETPSGLAVRTRTPRWVFRVVLGLFLLVIGFLTWRELQPLLTFRPAHAVVMKSSYHPETHRALRKRPPAGEAPRMRTIYVMDVDYRFQVDQRNWVGTRWARTNWFETEGAARECAAGYRAGMETTAWYNPGDPADAVLTRRVDAPFVRMLLVGLGITLLFVFLSENARRET